MAQPKRVLFVCLGNICRSPLVEAVFKKIIADKGIADDFVVDSCGTAGYHIGDDPDPRTLQTCQKHKVPIKHRVRQLSKDDFSNFEYIFGMDQSNMRDIRSKKPATASPTIDLFGSFDPQGQLIIEDPYYGNIEGFEQVYEQAVRCSQSFLKSLGYP